LNAKNLTNRFIRPCWISLPAAALFFLGAGCVNAEPVGDFFKKVSQSVSKAFQPHPTPSPTKKKTTTRASRRPTSPQSSLVGASPTPLEQPTNLVKEEKVTPTVTVLRASTVPAEKAKGDMPYGIPVPGHKGMVTSPYSPEGNYIDVSAFAPGSAVKDPYTGKIFLVP
jgi:cytoskeletal protein RodZ